MPCFSHSCCIPLPGSCSYLRSRCESLHRLSRLADRPIWSALAPFSLPLTSPLEWYCCFLWCLSATTVFLRLSIASLRCSCRVHGQSRRHLHRGVVGWRKSFAFVLHLWESKSVIEIDSQVWYGHQCSVVAPLIYAVECWILWLQPLGDPLSSCLCHFAPEL